MKSHISPKGPDKCNAQTIDACPFSGESGTENHFNTIEEARSEYENRMSTRLFTNKIQKNKYNLKFEENNSPLTKFHYEAKVKASGKINPNELNKESWKDFGFSGPNLLKMKANKDELFLYNKASEQELKNLTENERNAIKFFTSSAFANFNRVIFGNLKINDKEQKEYYNNIANQIDNGLNKKPKLTRTVYRGVKTRASIFGINTTDDYQTKTNKINTYIDKNYNIGKTVDFEGYQSTSLDPSVAIDWADKDGIVFEIMTPNGVNITSISQNADETEVLMPRNTKYMVVGVQKPDEIPFSYKSKPSHIIQLVAVDENNNILTDDYKHKTSKIEI